MLPGSPLNPIGQFATAGTGVSYGAGYNFTRHRAMIGEFMWDWLHPNVSRLPGITSANAHSHRYTLTANDRFDLRGQRLGTYFIAGGGWYLRHSSLTQTVVSGESVTGTQEWI